MKLDDHIAIWNHSAVKIFDIRHTVLHAGEWLHDYRFPASGFIYGVRGSANLLLGGNVYQTRRYYLLHGAKGMRLEIEAKDEFEFYILFYRAKLAFSGWIEMRHMLERRSPFEMQYGFEPSEPLVMQGLMSSMEQILMQSGSRGSVQIKGLFYQFIHEVLRDLELDKSEIDNLDLVTRAIRYLHEHYQEGISLDSLSNQLNYSPRYLSMRFKEQTGMSPIDYLIRFRVEHAKKLLRETGASLRDIAAHVGYADEYYFNRLFKKQTGYTPGRYQAMEREKGISEDRPVMISGLSIGVPSARRYSIDYDNHYQYITGGFMDMKRNKKSAFMLGMLLSFTLLLGACSGAGVNAGTNATSSTNDSKVTSTAATDSEQGSEAKTRTVSTVKGDVVVPAEPKRVVVLYLLGDAVALGVKPIGISEVYDGAAFAEELKGVKGLGHWFEANPEDVMALDPDLIIVASEDNYKNMKDIAPTVLIPFDQMTTEEQLHKLGEVFGKEKEAQTILNNFNDKVETSKEKLRSAGLLDKTVTIIEGDKKEMNVIESEQYGRGSQVIYEYLGMKAPEVVQRKIDTSKAAGSEVVSMEVLPQYVGDFLLRSSYEGMEDLSGNKVWASIPAVKAGNMIEIEFGLFYYSDIYSLNTQLDVITDKLLATVKDNS
ncbi:AraC family transcriptional regulator [Paenibacillus selenitireducens]|uniref:AraC family transcriptional regulator n=1 Tax=Paenibacillus selenitireducens TaxID=1324314 RepID=A0A1T2XMC5_9BACL|nr:AraC family transcriptional regulator [Paenibacillus selenitireducens]OPA81001.1 AraC family transcriptional regulator [Paenibacillus selenitireducens]